MANSNNRDVKMTLSVETLGTEDIKKLQTSVADLAKQGGAAAPEFQALADEIGRLGDQSAALQAFQALSNETGELVAKQDAASKSAEGYKATLESMRAATLAATEAQAKASAELDAAKVSQLATRDALAKLTAQTAEAKAADATYTEQVSKLKLAKIDQRAEVERLSAAMAKANTTVTEAEAAETKLEGTYNRAAAAAAKAEQAVTKQQASLKQSAAAAEALGLSTENVATSQGSLLRALNEAGQAALVAHANVLKLTQAEEELAAQTAFEKQAADSKRLFDTASYAELFEQALTRVAEAEREVAKAQAALDWQREAEAIVNATEATHQLAAQQEALLAVQRELQNDKVLAQQAAEAEKLADQAARLRLFTQVLDELDAKERAAGEAAASAGQKIKDAFGAVGVRSITVLNEEIAQVRAAMDTLKNSAGLTGGALQQAFTAGNAKIAELEAQVRRASGALTLADQAASLFKNSIGQIAAGNIIADGVGYLVNKVKELGREFVNANVQAEVMKRGLTAIYQSATTAAAQIDFLRSTAKASGISIGAIADSFVRFSAATKASNLPLQTTNDLFAAVTRAGATLGLTGERVTLVLDALGQMASKGVVSMEELRQQLGDSLPGALSVSAKGLGITDQALIKLVESGKLATEDFFPALTKGLASMQGENDTLSAGFGRLATALNTVAVTAGDAGWMEVLKGGLGALKIAIAAVVLPLAAMSEAIFGVAKASGILAAAVVTGTNPIEDLKKISTDAEARMKKLTDAFDDTGKAATAQGVQISAAAAVQAGHTSGVIAATLAQQVHAGTVGGTGNAYVQQMVAIQQNAAAVEAAITASQSLLKAKQDEGKGIVATAELTGSASKALDAHAAAAAGNVTASQNVVLARQREVSVTEASIIATKAAIAAGNDQSGQKARSLLDLSKTLEVQQAALEQSKQQTFEFTQQAVAAQTSADAYADNSTKIAAYKQAMEASQATVTSLTAQFDAQTATLGLLQYQMGVGTATQEQYDAAKATLADTTARLSKTTSDAAKNEAMYRDSVNDNVAALDRKARAAEANLQVSLALVNVQKTHLETMAREALSLGDTTLATEYTVDAKRKEIEAITLSTRIKNLELQADRAGIEIQIAALDPQDKLYAQKKQELEIRLEIIKAKKIEADASAEVIKGINDEIDAIRRKANGSAPNLPGGRGDGGQGGGSGPIGRGGATAGPNSYIGADGLERRNSDGATTGTFGNAVPLDKALAVQQAQGRRAFGAADIPMLQEAVKQAMDAKQFIDATERGSAGSVSVQAIQQTQSLVNATNAALKAAQEKQVQEQAQAAAVSTSHSLTIQLPNGTAGTFQMASAGDAQGITDFLATLGNAKKVS